MNFYELLLAKKLAGGGGGSAVINPLSVSANGTYSAPEGVDGYNPVEVAVPMPSGTYSIGANGDYDIASYASVAVSVPTGVFPSGTSNITSNGVYDVTNYESASVNVSGGGGDTKFAKLAMRTISGVIEDSDINGVIGSYAFYKCSKITEISFPNATSVQSSAFYGCSSLQTVNMTKLQAVGAGGFQECTNLTTISFPSVTTLYDSAFSNCQKLAQADFPLVSRAYGSATFYACYSLADVSMPRLEYIASYMFANCNKLSTASFPKASIISGSAFQRCRTLLSLYLYSNSVVTLDNGSVFFGTPIGGSTASTGGVYGSIFVPSSLYNTYIAATNWSAYAARFVSV